VNCNLTSALVVGVKHWTHPSEQWWDRELISHSSAVKGGEGTELSVLNFQWYAIKQRLRGGRPSHSRRQTFTELSPDTFFFSLSLPLMRKQPNYTCMPKNLLKLYCIWTWDTLWVFLMQFYSTLCVPFVETTTEEHLRHHLQKWRLRRKPKLLTLKFHCIWTWRFFSFLFFILFYFIYIYI
jgi:hypothetical protein